MKTVAVFQSACLVVLSLVTQTAAQEELCPPADGAGRSRGIRLNGVSLQAFSSAEEEAALLERLRSAGGDERTHAIFSLALGGSLEAFEYLLDREDKDGLLLFGGQYQNSDGTLCLDARIEAAILEHLQDMKLRRSLLGFFGKSLYRTRELFDVLRRLTASPEESDDLRALTMALTATNLAGLEEEMLALARSLLPHETPAQKGLLPDVHRRFVAYFERRGDPAAVPYLRDLLHEEGYSETLDYFRAKYSETRSLVYRALDSFPSEVVAEVFLAQFERLAEAPRDILTPYELAAFGDRAVRHAITDEQQERLSDVLSRLLEPEAPDASHAHKIHARVLDLQAAIATPGAAARILDELERQIDAETGFSRAMTAKALHALASLPVEIELDVPRFVRSASKLPARDRLLLATLVLEQHPDPAGHAFYLSQLEWIVEEATDPEPSFLLRYGLEADAAFEIVFRGLSSIEDPVLLARARERLDAMFAAENVASRSYISWSERLNERMGDESPRFQAFVEAQERAKLEERQARYEEKKARWLREQQAIVDANTSVEGIERHIQALSITGRGEAVVWLLIAGPDVLPVAHAALVDPTASLAQKARLMNVLGAVGDPSSAGPIIAATRATGEPGLMKNAFMALGQLPEVQDAFDFAIEQLEDGRSPIAQRSALYYFAAHRDRNALDHARRYSTPDTDPDVRLAALYLTARLGDDLAVPPILELLAGARDRSRDEVLLLALAELRAPDPFVALVPPQSGLQESPAFKAALNWSEFRTATGADKADLAIEMIETRERRDRRAAVRYLLEEGQLTILEDMLNVYSTLVFPLHVMLGASSVAQIILVEGRRLGFEIEWTLDGFRLVEG